MQPCSQPRYALIDRSKPTSGELLRVRIDLGCSMVTVVRRFGTPSSASTVSSQSPSIARSFRLKRVGVVLRVAPRPRIDSTGIPIWYAGRGTYQEQMLAFASRLWSASEQDDEDDDQQDKAAKTDIHKSLLLVRIKREKGRSFPAGVMGKWGVGGREGGP